MSSFDVDRSAHNHRPAPRRRCDYPYTGSWPIDKVAIAAALSCRRNACRRSVRLLMRKDRMVERERGSGGGKVASAQVGGGPRHSDRRAHTNKLGTMNASALPLRGGAAAAVALLHLLHRRLDLDDGIRDCGDGLHNRLIAGCCLVYR